jgi:hypothetical protein
MPVKIASRTELEAEDRSGDHTDCEERDEDPRPAPRERQVNRVARAQPEPFCEEHQRGKGDREADKRNVRDERERLHLPRLENVVLIRGDQDTGGNEGGADGSLLAPASGTPNSPEQARLSGAEGGGYTSPIAGL